MLRVKGGSSKKAGQCHFRASRRVSNFKTNYILDNLNLDYKVVGEEKGQGVSSSLDDRMRLTNSLRRLKGMWIRLPDPLLVRK